MLNETWVAMSQNVQWYRSGHSGTDRDPHGAFPEKDLQIGIGRVFRAGDGGDVPRNVDSLPTVFQKQFFRLCGETI